MEKDLTLLRRLMSEAVAHIVQEYFLLPVADAQGGEPLTQYRERVYAYELYHQLRSRWPAWQYSLGGEIDKQGHPIIHGPDLDGAKPDLLVHVPGEMDHNLVVVEIKASRPGHLPLHRQALMRDLRKLVAFRTLGYAAAFLLVFGEGIQEVLELARDVPAAELQMVELYYHRRPGTGVERIDWHFR